MKKVLLIEDNTDLLENMAELLELSSYSVYTATDGVTGIESAIENKPDLIVCDIMMPGLDGYGVLHMVQNNPELQQTPFIFLTAKTELQDLRKGMSLGADDYILKPYDSTDLLNAIKNRLTKVQHLKESIHEEEINKGGSDRRPTARILAEFVEGRSVDKYKRKQKIFSEGNHPIRLYYVVKGRVKIYKINNEGKEFIVQIIEEGEFFGFTPILENSMYKEYADTLDDTEIAAIPRNEFENLIHSNHKVCETFVQLLAKYATEKEEQLLHLAYNSLRRKVADALLAVKKKHIDDDSFTITRENLAAVAGTATESLIRTLTDFKAEKLIDIRDGRIVLLDLKKIEMLVN